MPALTSSTQAHRADLTPHLFAMFAFSVARVLKKKPKTKVPNTLTYRRSSLSPRPPSLSPPPPPHRTISSWLAGDWSGADFWNTYYYYEPKDGLGGICFLAAVALLGNAMLWGKVDNPNSQHFLHHFGSFFMTLFVIFVQPALTCLLLLIAAAESRGRHKLGGGPDFWFPLLFFACVAWYTFWLSYSNGSSRSQALSSRPPVPSAPQPPTSSSSSAAPHPPEPPASSVKPRGRGASKGRGAASPSPGPSSKKTVGKSPARRR